MRMADFMSKSDIIPVHYRGKPANCFIAIQSAIRMNQDPMLVMGSTYVVAGTLAVKATFAISLANTSGIYSGGIRYIVEGANEKFEGLNNNLKVTAWTTVKATGERIESTVTMAMAIAEGWTRNSKYKTLPELMLKYRAACFLIRVHNPEILNGMHMVEELEDIVTANDFPNSSPGKTYASTTDKLIDKLSVETPAEPPVEMVSQPIEEAEAAEIIEPIISTAEHLSILVMKHNVPNDIVDKWLKHANVRNLSELPEEAAQKCIDYVNVNFG